MEVAKTKGAVPVPVTVRLSPPLFCSTSPDPARPVTVPPIVNAAAAQVTCTLLTLAVAVPVPFVTVQFCAGLLGCVDTVTLYPPLTAVTNVKGPFPLIVRVSEPLFCSTNPVPLSPVTVPPIVKVVAFPPPPPPPPLELPFTPLHAAIAAAIKTMRRDDNFLLGIIGVLFFFSFFVFRNLIRASDLLAARGPPPATPPVRSPFARAFRACASLDFPGSASFEREYCDVLEVLKLASLACRWIPWRATLLREGCAEVSNNLAKSMRARVSRLRAFRNPFG